MTDNNHTTALGLYTADVWLDALLTHISGPGTQLLIFLDAQSEQTVSPLLTALADHLLQSMEVATLRLNLLTHNELTDKPLAEDVAFNIPQLAQRILGISLWKEHQPFLSHLQPILICSGTASGAAIRAAWKKPQLCAGIACIGGRLDLAGTDPLHSIELPVFVTDAQYNPQLHITLDAFSRLGSHKDLHILPDTQTIMTTEQQIGKLCQHLHPWLQNLSVEKS